MGIKELAYHQTPLGELVLRVRPEPRLNVDEVFEVKLGNEYLMSSLFTEGEKELSRIAIKEIDSKNKSLDIVVGGLGLGYTAAEVLKYENVNNLIVIEKFEEVIQWHLQELIPLGKVLKNDSRVELRKGDFFKLVEEGFDELNSDRKFDAVLLDIDHTPKHYLDPINESFYSSEGLKSLSCQLKDNGILAIWSDDSPENEFVAHLKIVFSHTEAHSVEFPNPYTGKISQNTVYLSRFKSDS